MAYAPRPAPSRAPAGAFWPLARDGLLWSLPAATALGLLVILGQVPPLMAALAWLASLLIGTWLARGRLRELEAIAVWIERLPEQQTGLDLRPGDGGASEKLLRPVLELARRLRRESSRTLAQQSLLASVIDALPDPILVVDAELMVIRANEAARRNFEAPDRPVPLARILRDRGVLAAVNGVREGGAGASVAFSPSIDRTKQFTSRVEPVDLGEGAQGVLIAIREQTEQVIIERMRSDFVANASHELRSPLASIQGFIETLRGPARDDAQARDQFLEVMAEETARMARLVEDLLSLSRIELAAHQPPTELCDIGGLLEQLARRVQDAARRAGVTLELSIPEDRQSVRGDPDQLLQLLLNLVDNAIKYASGGKHIAITAATIESAPADCGPAAGRACVRIDVTDQGPGIPKEHIPRLTERFYRVDKGRSRRVGGTGLGLAIVKHILRRHQGHLAVESEIDRGSTFSVYLPIAQA